MHPYDHARSSVRLYGGVWQDYFSCHSWFDATKSIQCRFAHRALRHHLEGVAEAIEVFGPSVRNSAGAAISLRDLGLQHVDEDCGIIPRARDWLADVDVPDWLPQDVPPTSELAIASARRFGGDAACYLALHDWFVATHGWCEGAVHLLFRHHSFGIFEAEERFGATLEIGAGQRVPTRVVAERHVQTVLGRIPPAVDVLRRIRGARWMLQATSPQKLGLT
ncbi:MAG: hypothetical protein K2Y27_23580 [Xanthobacteraceae bacterium]|nr:hypothetical protein [Xanthobacteraceae bacterium]